MKRKTDEKLQMEDAKVLGWYCVVAAVACLVMMSYMPSMPSAF